jgi:peptidoglycan/xylan/chitin deacetylase (PgdA/CDA1 family)
MNKHFLQNILAFFATSCLLTACAQTPQTQSIPVMPKHSTHILQSNASLNISVEPKQQNVWNVDDIDISKINPDKKLISFTFDDSIGSEIENLLAVFAAFNETHPNAPAYATLFCNGAYINDENVHTLSAAYAMGWELGNHSFSHADFSTLSPSEQLDEISQTEDILSRIDGKSAHLFRAPYGRIKKQDRANIPVPIIAWDVDTLDWAKKTEEEIYQTVMWKSYEGSVVLMHDGPMNTVSAVKRLLPDLYDAGFQVVSISMLAKAHECSLKNGGEYIRIRKNGTV